MCSTDPLKFRWSRRYICNSRHHRHLIASINLSQCFHISTGCAIIHCQLIHIDHEEAEALFPLLLWSLWCVPQIGYVMSYSYSSYSFGCTLHSSHYHYVYLSDIIIHWTHKMIVKTILSSVCLTFRPFSQLPFIYMQYTRAVCLSLLISLSWLWGYS